jgi:hypothetical protein
MHPPQPKKLRLSHTSSDFSQTSPCPTSPLQGALRCHSASTCGSYLAPTFSCAAEACSESLLPTRVLASRLLQSLRAFLGAAACCLVSVCCCEHHMVVSTGLTRCWSEV